MYLQELDRESLQMQGSRNRQQSLTNIFTTSTFTQIFMHNINTARATIQMVFGGVILEKFYSLISLFALNEIRKVKNRGNPSTFVTFNNFTRSTCFERSISSSGERITGASNNK